MEVGLNSQLANDFSDIDIEESRPLPGPLILLISAEFVAAVVGLFLGWSEAPSMVLLLVLTIPVGIVAHRLPTAADSWLGRIVVAGYVAKIVAATARYLALELLYGGRGDANGYHNHGFMLAPVWRSGEVPEFDFGTEFVQAATGFLYIPYVPTMLGGFFIFATLGFLGQLLLYGAFRRAGRSSGLKWYAFLIFFFPNILYWPSSIGKEALMMLFIGIATYGSVRLFESFEVRWMVTVASGLAGCAAIRSHIALLLAISLTVALLVGRFPSTDNSRIRRFVIVLLAVSALGGAVRFASEDFGVDLSQGISENVLEDEIDPIFAGVEEQTSRGGSAVVGTAIGSPRDIPEAVLRVVFKPLPPDAHNRQALINSLLEGTLLLVLVVWRLPAILKSLFRGWRSPYVLFSIVYTAGFIFGHSAILNLGIVARQRSQLIPFVFVLLVELGAKAPSKHDAAAEVPLPFAPVSVAHG